MPFPPARYPYLSIQSTIFAARKTSVEKSGGRRLRSSIKTRLLILMLAVLLYTNNAFPLRDILRRPRPFSLSLSLGQKKPSPLSFAADVQLPLQNRLDGDVSATKQNSVRTVQ